jgi:hypothetical protein
MSVEQAGRAGDDPFAGGFAFFHRFHATEHWSHSSASAGGRQVHQQKVFGARCEGNLTC